MQTDVHYYEDGNVRLKTKETISESDVEASKVAKTISDFEHSLQESLNEKINGLNEGPFKSLRRQLPVTKQKIEWNKIVAYNVGPGMSS